MVADLSRFETRRARFAAQLGEGLAVIPAARETVRNYDVVHPFRQDSDFYFLTGFPEPQALALIDPTHEKERYVLFVRTKDAERERWDGRRAGVEGSVAGYGADAAYPLGEFEATLRKHIRGHSTLYYRLGNPDLDRRILEVLEAAKALKARTGIPVPDRIEDPSSLLHELRLVKTPEEAAALRTACEITATGHAEAMRFAEPGMNERELQAALQYVFRSLGSARDAYPPIVASGANAVILHYAENDKALATGDLVLVDAGAEYQYLAADITRTFPVDGTFAAEQRALYGVVLNALNEAVAASVPHNPVTRLHEVTVTRLTEGMVELGLLPGPVDDAIAMGHYRNYFYHRTSHWLGMDVHDAGSYRVEGKGRLLEAGMALTVEPGVYVSPQRPVATLHQIEYDELADRDLAYVVGTRRTRQEIERRRQAADKVEHPIPEAFLGIGVRIEDDVLITENGHELLTRGVPVDPDEVEALCAEESALPRMNR